MEIDLNCDLGEGCGLDAQLMPLITSANISCGFHAGDTQTVRAALDLAARHGVRIGAHPGYPDREHFGRQEQKLSQDAVFELTAYQVGALEGLARISRQPLRYLKPHGALYNQACRNVSYAHGVVRAAQLFCLPVMGLPASRLEKACAQTCSFVREGFADRRYLADGSLVPRSRPDAFVTDPAEAVRQAQWLIRERGVQSLCVHGDNPDALTFVRALHDGLADAGFTIRAFA